MYWVLVFRILSISSITIVNHVALIIVAITYHLFKLLAVNNNLFAVTIGFFFLLGTSTCLSVHVGVHDRTLVSIASFSFLDFMMKPADFIKERGYQKAALTRLVNYAETMLPDTCVISVQSRVDRLEAVFRDFLIIDAKLSPEQSPFRTTRGNIYPSSLPFWQRHWSHYRSFINITLNWMETNLTFHCMLIL